MHGPVPAFGEEAEGDAVVEDVVYHLEGLEVLQDALGAVAEAGQRQDAQEAQDAGDEGLREDIGPGAEDGGFFPGAEDHQRIHQGACMVRGDDDGPVLRQRAADMGLVIAVLGTDIDVGPQETVQTVLFPDLMHPCG